MVKGLSEHDYQQITDFYNQRFQEKGHDIASVGWRDKASQWLRFDMLFRDYNPKGKVILDVGCGFGDLYAFLTQQCGDDFHYIGIDISSELINEAKKKYNQTNADFFVGDLFSIADFTQKDIDYAVESGMLSFKLENNDEYAKQIMDEMFTLSKEGVALNFLTDQVDYQLEKNHHYAMQDVLLWARALSSDFALFHDYPLWEFTVKIMKRR
ncbi:class I SAM-dependent methyltransferase [Colwellia asteriadis]|uniref:Class I SAM-dependent methyltransferase n=1 Tax=Colwellia asteriadis TaxID=517723 RepID=A0ABN1L636_9GAMM